MADKWGVNVSLVRKYCAEGGRCFLHLLFFLFCTFPEKNNRFVYFPLMFSEKVKAFFKDLLMFFPLFLLKSFFFNSFNYTN